jgi:hypothetical protein
MTSMLDTRALGGGRPKYFYLNSGSVGFGMTNATEDVLLVQYFLSKIYQRNTPKPLGRTLLVDGRFGPITHYWILFFREQVRVAGGTLKDGSNLDGGSRSIAVVDPWSTTITALNAAYNDLYPDGLTTFLEQSDLPVVLKQSFKR